MTTTASTHPSRGDRRSTVTADDGTALAVREYGRPDAPVTVVFAHGHCLSTVSWGDLRDRLEQAWGNDVRMVFYDHRGHGNSASAPTETYTIEQLGHDLGAIIRAVVPRGRFVLVGHSMGGMTAMAYARQNRRIVGNRLIGIALLATAASGIADDGLGVALAHPVVSLFQSAVHRAPRLMATSKRLSRRVCAPIVRSAGCGSRRVSARVVALASAMLNDTSIVTMAGFLGSLRGFDESASLAALSDLPVLVLCGSEDLMTPPRHSRTIAAHLPAARLVTVDRAGHMVIMERAAEVAAELVILLASATAPALKAVAL